MRNIELVVKCGDALMMAADVLALKYAQGYHGLDATVVERISRNGETIECPPIGQHVLIPSQGRVEAKQVLFVGVQPLYAFKINEIHDFSYNVLSILSTSAIDTKHLVMTLHGAGNGVDEISAFEAEICGVYDAIEKSHFPPGLRKITFIEINPERAGRLALWLNNLMPHKLPIQRHDTVFHYTDANALEGILTKMKLRASLISHLNDGKEYKHGISLIRKMLEEQRSKLKNTISDAGTNRLKDQIECQEEGLNKAESLSIVSVSFSIARDLLSQWRGYCKNGGFCIGFNKEVLQKTCENQGFVFSDCVYDGDSKDALARSVRRNLNNQRMEFQSCLDIAFIKDESFHEELEWRAVKVIEQDNDPPEWSFHVRNGVLVPYIEMDLLKSERFPINEIVIGPGLNFEKTVKSLELLFKRCKYELIPFSASDVPLLP